MNFFFTFTEISENLSEMIKDNNTDLLTKKLFIHKKNVFCDVNVFFDLDLQWANLKEFTQSTAVNRHEGNFWEFCGNFAESWALGKHLKSSVFFCFEEWIRENLVEFSEKNEKKQWTSIQSQRFNKE